MFYCPFLYASQMPRVFKIAEGAPSNHISERCVIGKKRYSLPQYGGVSKQWIVHRSDINNINFIFAKNHL